jgi:integrase
VIEGLAVKIELKHVHRYRDRHGKERIYVRVPGRKAVAIRAKPDTKEFLAAYQAAVANTEVVLTIGAPGSFAWLIQRYYGSAEYRQLSQRTKHVRRLILDKLMVVHGDKPFARLEPRHIREWRDARAGKPEAANSIVKGLRAAFRWAVEAQVAERNPARDVPLLRPSNPEGFHTWTIEEVAQFRAAHPLGTKARLSLELLLFTGCRRSDVVTLGRQMVRDGWIHFVEAKGRGRRPKQHAIPILPELQAVLAATPSGHLNYLVTAFGRPYTAEGFGNWFRRQCNAAGLLHCSAHGLRKAGATIAAENGATEHQLMAIFDWDSPKQASLYTRKANRRKLAGDAMRLLANPDHALANLAKDSEA